MKRKSKDSGLMDRKEFQKSEGYAESSSSMPDGRLQSTKQVLTPEQLGVDSDAITSGVAPSRQTTVAKAAKTIRSNVSVKPDSAVDIEDGKQLGGVPLGAEVATLNFAGTNAISPADDISRNPHTDGGYRPATRYGKKITEQNFIINNTISEQVAPKYDESKDVRENPDSLQGYNGRKQFKQARGKKNTGCCPQSLLFDRSADILEHNEQVYVSGQILDSITAAAGYPTRGYTGNTNPALNHGDDMGYEDIDSPMRKTNYSLDSMKIHINKNGMIDDIGFLETAFVPSTSYKERDVSNLNWQVDLNNVTASMVRMQTELGRETTDKWSPLAYVVEQPYQYNMLYHDMENVTAALSASCYRAAVSSLAVQINYLGKDGAKPIDPIVYHFLDGIGIAANSDLGSGHGIGTLFNAGVTRYGIGSGIISMFDSTGKYATKADVLTMQRSMKLHLSTADNNMNPFHCKKEFIKALNTAHTFSTIDGSYNPNLPVYATRKVKLILPQSLQYFLEGWERPTAQNATTNDPVTGTSTRYFYSYNDIRNRYTMPVKHPFVEGLCKWILQHENDFVKAFGTDTTISMDCSMDFLSPTLFQLIVCSAMQDIAFMRNTYFKDILFAGEQSTYIWDDLTSLRELNPLWSNQLTIKSYDEAIGLGKLNSASTIRLLWPEIYSVSSEQVGDGALYFAPWYFNEEQFTAEPDGNGSFLSDSHASVMTMPSIRSGVRHEYVDFLYSMEERDVRLCLDRMTTILCDTIEFIPHDEEGVSAFGGYVPNGGVYVNNIRGNSSKRIHISALRYDENSDGRVAVEYDDDVTYAALMCAPREIGFIAPGLSVDQARMTGLTVRNGKRPDDGTADVTFDAMSKAVQLSGVNSTHGYYYTPWNVPLDGSTAWNLVSYSARGNGTPIGAGSIAVTAAIQQDFVRCFANRSEFCVGANRLFYTTRGYVPCLSAMFAQDDIDTLNVDTTTTHPFYQLGGLKPTNGVGLISLVSILWPLLNRVFFVINPFENCYVAGSATEAKASALIDPMELGFIFGISGSLASDYNQDTLERLSIYDQLNLNYLEDVYVKDSLIFRE